LRFPPEGGVDEFLSDKEQVERVRLWWRENGWFLIGGAALGGLGLFGYNQFNAYRARQSEQAAALYESVKTAAEGTDLTQATALLAQLRADFPDNAYTQQAGLLIARAALVSDPEQAAEDLRFAMENSTDPELAMVARLRLVRVLAYREQYQEALGLLAVESPGQFAGRIDEIKGDIYVALGQINEARAAYLAAMVAPGAEVLDRSFLQMKLSDLPIDSVVAADSVPPAAPATPEAAAPAPAATAPGEGA
jgi:predicted negative regulator of RcsB-dependent stress response